MLCVKKVAKELQTSRRGKVRKWARWGAGGGVGGCRELLATRRVVKPEGSAADEQELVGLKLCTNRMKEGEKRRGQGGGGRAQGGVWRPHRAC